MRKQINLFRMCLHIFVIVGLTICEHLIVAVSSFSKFNTLHIGNIFQVRLNNDWNACQCDCSINYNTSINDVRLPFTEKRT